MTVFWGQQAESNRADILEHIATDNARASSTMSQLFVQSAATLGRQPGIGSPGRIPGTREWLVNASFRMVYEVHGDDVRVLAIVHTARQWPSKE